MPTNYWICNKCQTRYSSEDPAKECEKVHLKMGQVKIQHLWFPKQPDSGYDASYDAARSMPDVIRVRIKPHKHLNDEYSYNYRLVEKRRDDG